MSTDKKHTDEVAEEAVKDLEVLTDAELDDVSGGPGDPTTSNTGCMGACGCGGGGCCGTGMGTTHEANFKKEPGDTGVEFNPTKKK